MSFELLEATRIEGLRTINGQPFVAAANPCNYRINVDPTSNPDPFSGGLIVTAASTQPLPVIFNVPLSLNQPGLGPAAPYRTDPDSDITVGPNTITINKTGGYQIAMQMDLLSHTVNPANIAIFQILLNGQSVFATPPICSAAGNFIDLSLSPIGGLYAKGCITTGDCNAFLTAGDVIACVFWLAADSAAITLTSNISIIKL